MSVELVVPSVGESITEVQIAKWLKSEGDDVQRDEGIVELETDKATVELPAPVSGKLTKLAKAAGEAATVGEVIGYMEEGGAPAGSKPATRTETRAVAKPTEPPAPPPAPAAAPEPPAAVTAAPVPTTPKAADEEIVPMSPIRRRIAERLVSAQQTAALLTTFNEIDMSAVAAIRAQYRDLFEKRYGIRLGMMSFFVKAAIDALKLVPQLNAEIRGTDIIYKNHYDIGVAVSSQKGLVVPVIRGADRLSFAELEKVIADFGARAQENKIELVELEGGTFTISNGGIFGSLMSTPIVNPPQSGVLGMHAIQDRPVARDGQVVIRPMMYVALTYDHRVVDGREAVTFLKRIKEGIENPARLLIEV
jgi:2-oxoglutarate dehydrogenase E2 component (dihydrolipoamide succinyltransferase)